MLVEAPYKHSVHLLMGQMLFLLFIFQFLLFGIYIDQIVSRLGICLIKNFVQFQKFRFLLRFYIIRLFYVAFFKNSSIWFILVHLFLELPPAQNEPIFLFQIYRGENTGTERIRSKTLFRSVGKGTVRDILLLRPDKCGRLSASIRRSNCIESNSNRPTLASIPTENFHSRQSLKCSEIFLTFFWKFFWKFFQKIFLNFSKFLKKIF